MSGYVLDDLALQTGLTGDERHRRELSRLLHDAIGGGPHLVVPALCLTAAGERRPPLVTHLADIIAVAPPGVLRVAGLARTDRLDELRDVHPGLPWPAVHAVVCAQTVGVPVLTADPGRYGQVAVDALAL